jgi:hypothetical protein
LDFWFEKKPSGNPDMHQKKRFGNFQLKAGRATFKRAVDTLLQIAKTN